jgi:hypothetical protein
VGGGPTAVVERRDRERLAIAALDGSVREIVERLAGGLQGRARS